MISSQCWLISGVEMIQIWGGRKHTFSNLGGGGGRGGVAPLAPLVPPPMNNTLHACIFVQVQKLLELMGMTKYQGAFKDKGVDGSILAQCDDQVLQEVCRSLLLLIKNDL